MSSQKAQSITFEDLEPQSFLFKQGGKDYVAKEATEGAAVKYQNARIKSAKFGPDGKPVGFENVADVEPLLISLCTFEITLDKDSKEVLKPVNLIVVNNWPAKLCKKLFKEIERISGLVDEETEEILTEQIKILQDKLDAIKLKGGGREVGKLTGDMTNTSD